MALVETPSVQGGTTLLDMSARRIVGLTAFESGQYRAVTISGHNQATNLGYFPTNDQAVAEIKKRLGAE